MRTILNTKYKKDNLEKILCNTLHLDNKKKGELKKLLEKSE